MPSRYPSTEGAASSALVGHSGFVGSSLLRQRSFSHLYRSTDIGQIAGGSFDTVVCAGAPAQKWVANREPDADRARIEALIGHLRTVRCRSFVLISTVDVFQDSHGVDEATAVDEHGLRPEALVFDVLTFTLATGDAEFVDSASETIAGIRLIKRELPGVLTSLGVSNLSFGLAANARPVLNSVMLFHSVQAGLDMAIVNPAHITPYAVKKNYTSSLWGITNRGRADRYELL